MAKLMFFISISQFCFCCQAGPLDSWNLVSVNNPVQITSMAYGNGTFVGNGGGLQFVSHDGSNWTSYTAPPVITQGGVAYGNGTFLAFGTNTQFKANYILQSTNGITWTQIYTSSNTLFAAAYGNNAWVFVGRNEIVTANLTSSNWSWSDYQPIFSPACITYGNGVFVIGGNLGNYYSIFSSSDGNAWQFDCNLTNSLATYFVPGIAYGNGVFVASTASTAFVSSNLLSWNLSLNYYAGFCPSPVAFGGNLFITYLANAFFSSPNGYTWTWLNNDSGLQGENAIIYGQGAFVAADYFDNNIYQSGVFSTQTNSIATTLDISTYPGVTINGTAGAEYQIQFTTNLNSAWLTLTNFMLPYSPYVWVDTSSPVVGQRFYRTVQLQ